MSALDIQRHIRQATAHEDAAGRHEDKYAQQMTAAGHSMFTAFTLALKGAEEFQGRQIDDKAILRIYQSTKPRPWWDKALKTADVLVEGRAERTPDRERAKRLIQWHVDPTGASARRAQHALKEAARRKKLEKQGRGKTQGARVVPERASGARVSPAREAKHAERIVDAATTAATGGRAPAEVESAKPVTPPLDDLLAELSRIGSAVRKVKPEDREEVRSMLVAAARDVERYVP
jgi:hypothetical protein